MHASHVYDVLDCLKQTKATALLFLESVAQYGPRNAAKGGNITSENIGRGLRVDL